MKYITQDLPKCKHCAIRNNSLFGELEKKHLDEARKLRSSQITFSTNEYLYHEGDIPNKAYTLYQGWIALFKNLEDGNRQILRFSLPGDLLCFQTNHTAMDHSAIALTDVTLCAFPLDKFKKSITQLPELSLALSSINNILLERCYATLTSISKYNAEAKIAYLLLSLYIREQAGEPDKNKYIIFPITQEDIGDALGITSIHVNRVVQEMTKKGLIACKNKKLTILDQATLAKIAKVDLEQLKELMYVV